MRVGTGAGRRQRFIGVLLVEWRRSTSEREETYRVYRSRSGKYVLHLKRSSESVWTAGPDGQATGWRKHFASDQQWGTLPKTASLQVFDDLDSLREHVPQSCTPWSKPRPSSRSSRTSTSSRAGAGADSPPPLGGSYCAHCAVRSPGKSTGGLST